MYEQKFGLSRNPFRTMAEGSSVFVALKQAKAISNLQNALGRPDSVVTVSGPAGVGKTTIVSRSLLSSDKLKVVAWIRRMRLAPDDVLQLLLNGFGIRCQQNSEVQRYATFQRMLRDRAAAGSRVTIVVEDAKHLSNDSLLELEALTAADENGAGGANVILMGAPEIDQRLAIPELARLRQRTRKVQTVEPLNVVEVGGYLKHSMRVAGANYDKVFAEGSATMLYCCSEGIPRVINNVCDAAFTAAAEREIDEIGPQLLRDIAVREYGIEPIPVPKIETTLETSSGVPALQVANVEAEDVKGQADSVRDPEAEVTKDHTNPAPDPVAEVVTEENHPAPGSGAGVVTEKIDPAPDPEPEVVNDPADPTPKSESEPGSETEFELETEVGTAFLRKLDYDPDIESDDGVETETRSDSDTGEEAESGGDADKETEAESEPDYELEMELGTAQLRQLEIDCEAMTGVETSAESVAKVKPTRENRAGPQPGRKLELELEPEPENESLSEAGIKNETPGETTGPKDTGIPPALPDSDTGVEPGPEKSRLTDSETKAVELTKETSAGPQVPDLDALEAAILAAQAGEPLCEKTESKDAEAGIGDTEITLDRSLEVQPAEPQEPDTASFEVPIAGSLEDISEKMAETLFGVEFQQETAEVLSGSQAAGTIPSESDEDGAAAVDSFPSSSAPANDPNSQSSPVGLQRKSVAAETAAASAKSPASEPDDHESPTSLNHTLKALDKPRTKDEKPAGFFGRFKKTLGVNTD